MTSAYLAAQIEQIAAMLRPEGTTVAEVRAALNVCQGRTSVILTAAEAEGRAFGFRKARFMVYFPTLALMKSAQEAHREGMREKDRKRLRDRYTKMEGRRTVEAYNQQRAAERALRVAEAEQRKQRARLEREAAAAQKQREKIEAKTQRDRLRAETKALGRLGKQKGTANPAPAPVRGPAHLKCAPDLSRAKITKLDGCPASRWDVTGAAKLFSEGRYGEYPSPVSAWAEAAAA